MKQPIVEIVLLFAISGLLATQAIAAPPIKEDLLAGLTQNWDKALSGAQRFSILESLNSQAVRDSETGLVWEKAPSGGPTTWAIARVVCLNKTVGGRKRLEAALGSRACQPH
jgi:hypothetical protein